MGRASLAPNPIPYITHADVAAYLSATLTPAREATLTEVIVGVAAAAAAFCNHCWGVSDPQTELFDGGTSLFFPAFSPIGLVTPVAVDGEAVDAEVAPTPGSTTSPPTRCPRTSSWY